MAKDIHYARNAESGHNHAFYGGVYINEVFCGLNNKQYNFFFFRDTIHMRMLK